MAEDHQAAAARTPLRTILAVDGIVLAVVLGLYTAYHLRRILVFLLIATFFAVVLSPAVDFLHRRGMRRGLAVTVVFFSGVTGFGGLIYLFVRPIYSAGRRFADQLPSIVQDAQNGRGRVGELIRRYHVENYVRTNAPKLGNAISHAGGPALTVLGSLIAGLAGLFIIGALAFLILLEGPALAEAALRFLPEQHAERVRRVARDVSRSVTGYVIGNFTTSCIAGVVVYVTLRVVGVPFAFLFGLWVAMVDLLPLVGGLLAGVPTVAIAFVHSPTAGIVTLVVFLIYQQIENHILNPIIMSKTVRLNPLWVLLSVLVGADLGGFVGALLAIPTAGAIQVVARDIWDERRGAWKPEPTVGEEERPATAEENEALDDSDADDGPSAPSPENGSGGAATRRFDPRDAVGAEGPDTETAGGEEIPQGGERAER